MERVKLTPVMGRDVDHHLNHHNNSNDNNNNQNNIIIIMILSRRRGIYRGRGTLTSLYSKWDIPSAIGHLLTFPCYRICSSPLLSQLPSNELI